MNAFKQNFGGIVWEGPAVSTAKISHRRPSKRGAFPTPMVSGDYEAYECPVTGTMIEGRHAHSENLKQTGCRLLENGEFEDTKKNGRARADAKIDAAVDKAVDEIAGTLDI